MHTHRCTAPKSHASFGTVFLVCLWLRSKAHKQSTWTWRNSKTFFFNVPEIWWDCAGIAPFSAACGSNYPTQLNRKCGIKVKLYTATIMLLWLLLIVFALIWQRLAFSAMWSWSISFNWNKWFYNKQQDSTTAIVLIILFWPPNKNPTWFFWDNSATSLLANDFISATLVLSVKYLLPFFYFLMAASSSAGVIPIV